MSFAQSLCEPIGSTERPMTLVLRLSNSGFSAATRPSSVVHTGVKSFGCENSTAQESPFHSWKLRVPSVVSAVKSGASSPKRSVAMVKLLSPAQEKGQDSVQGCVSRVNLALPAVIPDQTNQVLGR